jgi:hypothetical protein
MRKGDAEAAIVAGSFLEVRLGFTLKSLFVQMPDRGDQSKLLTEAALFEGYGPLASFYAKIDLACALNILSTDMRLDFHIIRSIRNDFAHTVEGITFLDDEVVKKLNRIRCIEDTKSAREKSPLSARAFYKRYYLSACEYFGGYITGYADVQEVIRTGRRPSRDK